MLVIGLTGGIGSGKTTVADLFAKKDIIIIDTDQLAREVIEPGQEAFFKIIEKFGNEVLTTDHTLNRAYLRKIIFADSNQRLWLEQLLHPLIRARIKLRLEKVHSPYCIVIIPLLFETEPNPLINRILVVDAPVEAQLKRAQIRDQSSADEIKMIIQSQTDREHRLKAADDIIYNNGDLQELIPQIDKLHEFYLALSQ